eukprot:gene24093-10188_t
MGGQGSKEEAENGNPLVVNENPLQQPPVSVQRLVLVGGGHVHVQ